MSDEELGREYAAQRGLTPSPARTAGPGWVQWREDDFASDLRESIGPGDAGWPVWVKSYRGEAAAYEALGRGVRLLVAARIRGAEHASPERQGGVP